MISPMSVDFTPQSPWYWGVKSTSYFDDSRIPCIARIYLRKLFHSPLISLDIYFHCGSRDSHSELTFTKYLVCPLLTTYFHTSSMSLSMSLSMHYHYHYHCHYSQYTSRSSFFHSRRFLSATSCNQSYSRPVNSLSSPSFPFPPLRLCHRSMLCHPPRMCHQVVTRLCHNAAWMS